MPKKIITMCRQGLVRSVALADVLKMHFEPVDVIPVGHAANSKETLRMLFEWADSIIVMQAHYLGHIPQEFLHKARVCEVGHDNYHNSRHRQLIDACWNWVRRNSVELGISEHSRKV